MSPAEMALIGKMIAGMTHELKNALAVISESNGLIQDLIGLSQNAPFQHSDRLEKATHNISNHLTRGVRIADRLNSFAHHMDLPEGRVALDEMVDLVVFLMHRTARQKQREIRVITRKGAPSMITHPIRLCVAVAAFIHYGLEQEGFGGTLTVGWQKHRREIDFETRFDPPPGTTLTPRPLVETMPAFAKLTEALGGSFDQQTRPDQIFLQLRLPLKYSGPEDLQ